VEGTDGPRIVQRVTEAIGVAQWGNGPGQGAIHYDGPGRCLVVRLPQPEQQAVEAFLADWRNAE
jgi:hypothetical protein